MTERVADMTVTELKTLIAEVVSEQLNHWQKSVNVKASLLPKRTPEEQDKINQELIKWLDEWSEKGDAEEQKETFEYLQKVLR